MDKTKQLIIIGGGTSISEGIQKGLLTEIYDKFILGCNYSFNYFESTALVYVDYNKFYNNQKDKLSKLPLIIGHHNSSNNEYILNNTILLKNGHTYTRDLSSGCYNAILCGIFSLSLGIYLLDVGEIFLLGFDFSGEPSTKDTIDLDILKNGRVDKRIPLNIKTEEFTPNDYKEKQIKFLNSNNDKLAVTHFYQSELKHRGTGKIDYFYTHNPDDLFSVYRNENKIKIWNVSKYSRINTFPKISYDEMFGRLNNDTFNQDELRTNIINKLKEIK